MRRFCGEHWWNLPRRSCQTPSRAPRQVSTFPIRSRPPESSRVRAQAPRPKAGVRARASPARRCGPSARAGTFSAADGSPARDVPLWGQTQSYGGSTMVVRSTSCTESVRSTRQGPVVALAVGLLAVVTGCTATASPEANTPPPSAGNTTAATASSAPVERAPRLSDLDAGTLIASGEFTGPSASVSGRVEIFSTGFEGITSTVSDLSYGGVEGAR